MKFPVQITFRNLEPSPTVDEWVQAETEKIETFYDQQSNSPPRMMPSIASSKPTSRSLEEHSRSLTVTAGGSVTN